VWNIAKSLLALAISAGVVSLSQEGSAQAPGLATADPWKLNQTADSCYLQRSYGTGEHKTDLLIQSFGSTTPYHVMVRGDAVPLRPQRAESARVGFGGEKSAKETLVLIGKSGEMPMLVVLASPPRPFGVNFLSWLYRGVRTNAPMGVPTGPSATELYVDLQGGGPIDLPLGPMSSEYSRLDSCAAAVEHKWALATVPGGAAMDAPQITPETAGNWQIKYPENLLLNRISGLVELRMTVDAKGRAHDCVMQMATWSPQFGERACSDIQEYARFVPAHDGQGKPVSALYRTAMMFMIYDW
jgi:hypothetical protein